MHAFNYPDNLNYGLYMFLVLGINLPWTLSCVRNYIIVPNTPQVIQVGPALFAHRDPPAMPIRSLAPAVAATASAPFVSRVHVTVSPRIDFAHICSPALQTRLFCVAYDVMITKPFFRNHVLLMVCSVNGFIESTFFPIMLMDIMNNSQVLANVARSVTDNVAALGWVAYLFVCTVVIYAQFGLTFFEEWFVYDGDAEDSPGCHSVVSCFMLIFYHGDQTEATSACTQRSSRHPFTRRMAYPPPFRLTGCSFS